MSPAQEGTAAPGLDWTKAPCGLFAIDRKNLIAAANDRFCGMLGHSPAEVVGRPLDELLPAGGKLFYQTHLYPMVRLNGKADEVRLSFRRKDGQELPVLLEARFRREENLIEAACLPVTEMAQFQAELILGKTRAEEALKSNAAFARLQAEAAQQAAVLDRKIFASAAQARDLERIGNALFHQLREPVRKIKLLTDLLERHPEDARQQARATASSIRASADRLSALVRGIRDYVALTTPLEDAAAVALSDCVAAATARVRLVAACSDLEVRCGDLPAVQGDRAQLELLFFTLFDNTARYKRPKTRPTAAVTATIVTKNAFRSIAGQYHYAEFARIVVEDNSRGFEAGGTRSVFEMFARSEPMNEGLGSGLSRCRKVVENHHGSIELDSSMRSGSRFIIHLPLKQ